MTKGNRFEKVIDRLYGEMDARITRASANFRNEKAPGRTKTPETKQLENYLQMKDNPQAWQALVAEHGVKGALKYYRAMESLAKRRFENTKKSLGPEFSNFEFQGTPLPQPILDAVMQAGQLAAGAPPQQQPPMPQAPMPQEQPMPQMPQTPQMPPEVMNG